VMKAMKEKNKHKVIKPKKVMKVKKAMKVMKAAPKAEMPAKSKAQKSKPARRTVSALNCLLCSVFTATTTTTQVAVCDMLLACISKLLIIVLFVHVWQDCVARATS
jgi:hypothetical protein